LLASSPTPHFDPHCDLRPRISLLKYSSCAIYHWPDSQQLIMSGYPRQRLCIVQSCHGERLCPPSIAVKAALTQAALLTWQERKQASKDTRPLHAAVHGPPHTANLVSCNPSDTASGICGCSCNHCSEQAGRGCCHHRTSPGTVQSPNNAASCNVTAHALQWHQKCAAKALNAVITCYNQSLPSEHKRGQQRVMCSVNKQNTTGWPAASDS
jgi:hypothetical protein